MNWLIGVDVGGTFTDLYAVDSATGASVIHKTPSTPDDPSRAIAAGLAALRDRHGVPVEAMARFAHGTTVATNALIQRRGGRTALITTRGFRDLLEIGRQIRPKIYDLQADHPPPLVPRALRFEAAERIGADGEILEVLSDAEIERLLGAVLESGAEVVAIGLLFSFVNPVHEQRLAAAFRERAPQLHVSASFEVQPEFREYERISTTVLNGFLQPSISRYMENLKTLVATLAPGAAIGINQSSGGLMTVDDAARLPIRTALSGPAAGVVGATQAARLSGRGNLITLDMGGTSTDVCLIRDSRWALSFQRDIAGFPVRLPVVDIHAIGAGGGSIAWLGPDGLLQVGPQSAGAVPGPACYGQGGEEPTVTDANVLLGRLPLTLVGGDMTLDRDAAARAMQRIGEPLGRGPEAAAMGLIRVVVSNMVRAIRAVSVERGHDPREFILVPYGGAGGLHAVEIAREIGIREILVPYAPGVLCAQGLLAADLKSDFVATCRLALESDLAPLGETLARLAVEAEDWFGASHISPDTRRRLLSLEMRYVGQNYELPVLLEGTDLSTLPAPAELHRRFVAEHERAYGHADPDAPVEIVNLRLSAIGELPPLPAPVPTGTASPTPRGRRAVWFDEAGPLAAGIWARSDLGVGARVAGPAVIEQLDATTVLPPGCVARVDGALNLRLEVSP